MFLDSVVLTVSMDGRHVRPTIEEGEAAVVGEVRDRERTEVGPEVVAARASSAEEATERAVV